MKTLLFALLLAANAMAIPQLVNYQGQLTSPAGLPLDTTVAMTFRFYPTSVGGVAAWTEVRPSVTVTDGLFGVSLGSITALSDLFGANGWIGVTVGNNSEMIPREQVVSVAHAYRVGTVDGASGGTISGKLNVGSGNSNSGLNANVLGVNNHARGDHSVIAGGGEAGIDSNSATGTFATISGGRGNLASGSHSTIGGGLDNSASLYSVVAGGSFNTAGPSSAILGGNFNEAIGEYFSVGGGYGNSAGGQHAIIGGGNSNVTTGNNSHIGGGAYNKARGNYSVVAGGGGTLITDSNSANYDRATIGGGRGNRISGNYGTVSGGQLNTAGSSSFVGGGYLNTISGTDAVIGGGYVNSASAVYTTIGGGIFNVASGNGALVGGGGYNKARGGYSVVAGGGGASESDSNSVTGSYSTISGGSRNIATSSYSTVGGGQGNRATDMSVVAGGIFNIASADRAAIIGGDENVASGTMSTIGGGYINRASGYGSFIGGGLQSHAAGTQATIGGGGNNRTRGDYSVVGGGGGPFLPDSNSANFQRATIGGGRGNHVTGIYGTIAGGQICTAGTSAFVGGGYNNQATGQDAVIAGGTGNTASGASSTIPGGTGNEATGIYSFAAGRNAHALHPGAFVWGDGWGTSLSSSNNDQFLMRASGGVFIWTNSTHSSGVYVSPGGGSWQDLCDSTKKENFQELNTKEILDKVTDLPLSEWNYKSQNDNIRHIGPMAQDFYAAFSLGENDTTISTIDPDGVALAAIQELAKRNASLEAEVAELKQLVEQMIQLGHK